MLRDRKAWLSAASQGHFKSGLYLSIGCFNLLLALLPDRVQKVLQESEVIGDRDLGLTYLRQAALEVDGVQQPLAQLLLLALDLARDLVPVPADLADACASSLHARHPKVRSLTRLSLVL